MRQIRKVFKGSRIRTLGIVVIVVGLLFYAHYSSTTCLSDYQTVVVRQKISMSPSNLQNDNLETGKYFRRTPLNRTKADKTVNALMKEIQLRKLQKRKESEETRRRTEELIRSQMDSDLSDIDLDNLDRYYHGPIISDETETNWEVEPKRRKEMQPAQEKAVKPKQEQKVTPSQTQQPVLKPEVNVGLKQEVIDGQAQQEMKINQEIFNDQYRNKMEMKLKQEVIHAHARQEVARPDLDQNEQKYPNLSEGQGDVKGDKGADQNSRTESQRHDLIKGQIIPQVLSRKKNYVSNSYRNSLINLPTEKTSNNDLNNKELLAASTTSLTPRPLVKKKRQVEKKMKIKKKISVVLLPDSFPYYRNGYPAPSIGNSTCTDSLCSDFLSPEDHAFYKYCVTRLKRSDNYKERDHASGACHFMNGTNRAAVALASLPGSGNTWVRGLLEQATGICTGSIFCDNSLRAFGMNGEGVRSGAVLAVKTHKSIPVTWTDKHVPSMSNEKNPAYGSAILLIRNPFNALVAEWNRGHSTGDSSTHTGEALQTDFGDNEEWTKFIKVKISGWHYYFRSWLVGGSHRVMVVRYEDVKTDPLSVVRKMLDFLKFPYDPVELEQRMRKDYGKFKRKHKMEFEHFTQDQKTIIMNTIYKTIDYLKHNYNNTLGIEEYLKI